jgi:uncharacterized protein
MLAILDQVEHDAGPKTSGPERFCVVERAAKPADDLLRFVAGPDETLVPDLKRKLPGRGVWVTGRRSVLEQAIKRGAFARSLRQSIKIPADLPDLVDRLLVRAALDALAMALKAGAVVTGFERVETALAAGRAVALIHAAEASPDGVRKLRNAAITAGLLPGPHVVQAAAPSIAGENPGPKAQIPVIHAFTLSQLDLALGRPNVVHAALLGGREGGSFLARWRTLERYRSNDGRDERAGNEAVQPRAASELGTE